MTLFLILVFLIIGILCYNFIPTSLPKNEIDSRHPAIEYVLTHADLLQSSFGYQFADIMEKDNKIQTDAIYPITILNCTAAIEGFCIDFAKDNGCMVITPDYDVYFAQTSGNYDALSNYDLLSFSPYDGIIYTVKEVTSVLDKGAMLHPTDSDKLYQGQQYSGEGGIILPDAYISDRYGADYRLYASASLPYFTCFDQGELSIYYSDYGRRSEGNCTLTALFTALSYLRQSNLCPKIPAHVTTTSVDATKDAFYATYAQDPSYVIDTPKTLPVLYEDIRQYVIANYHYKTGEVNPLVIETIGQYLLNKYGCSMKAVNHYLWSYETEAIASIKKQTPVVFNVGNSQTYSSHSMVIYGYRSYVKKTVFERLTFWDYICLLELADSWNPEPRFFDTAVTKLIGSMVTLEE